MSVDEGVMLKSTGGSMMLLPPAEGLCQECAIAHAPEMPHNRDTLYFGTKWVIDHGREAPGPTWADAAAHCTIELWMDWATKLAEMGVPAARIGSISMRVLSLWQPWASLIAELVKTIETRSWPAPAWLIGQRIAIHAAKHPSGGIRTLGGYEYYVGAGGAWMRPNTIEPAGGRIPMGAIVATARLAECLPIVEGGWPANEEWRPAVVVDDDGSANGTLDLYLTDDPEDSANADDQLPYGDYRDGRWAWLLEDVEPLVEPVPFNGGQRLTKMWTVPS